MFCCMFLPHLTLLSIVSNQVHCHNSVETIDSLFQFDQSNIRKTQNLNFFLFVHRGIKLMCVLMKAHIQDEAGVKNEDP